MSLFPSPGAHPGRRGRMIAARAGRTPRYGGEPDHREVPYFLNRINTGNRYNHQAQVYPVSRPKARTATGHRFDPVNPKDEDACGSGSICSGCSRPTIEVGGSGATALTCSVCCSARLRPTGSSSTDTMGCPRTGCPKERTPRSGPCPAIQAAGRRRRPWRGSSPPTRTAWTRC